MTERSIDHPILFSAPMALALLAGSKSETRRLVRPGRACPYASGDALWVREAWRLPVDFDAMSGAESAVCAAAGGWERPSVRYEADGGCSPGPAVWSDHRGRYRHARFMPRWASRLALRVLGVRIERLQAITYRAAIAEGVSVSPPRSARKSFAALWDTLHPEHDTWAADPLVYVVRFERKEASDE